MDYELTRVCTKCEKEKAISLFNKDRRGPGGISRRCRVCANAKNRAAYYKRNQKRTRRAPKLSDEELSWRNAARAKRWRAENPDYGKKVREKYNTDLEHRAAHLKQMRAWGASHKEWRREYNARYRAEHKEELNQKNREWHRAHPEYNSAAARKARVEARKNAPPPEKLEWKPRVTRLDTERNNETAKRLYRENATYKISSLLRGALNKALCGDSKSGSAVKDLGCTIPELRVYLESMFYLHRETGEEMTWENHTYAGWHIDHIKPLASFDLTDRKQLLKACHYTNLQPLWAIDNLEKGAKVA